MPVLLLSFAIVLLDQVAKHLVETQLPRDSGLPIIPGFFDLHYVQNTGAAWGMLQGMNGLLVAFSFVVMILLIIWRRQLLGDTGVARVAAGMILGGIIGNLIDRVRLSYVVDYLDFFFRGHHFPAFNVADAAICIGVGLYLLTQARPNPSAAASSPP